MVDDVVASRKRRLSQLWGSGNEILAAALLAGLAAWQLAQADGPKAQSSDQRGMSCREMMVKAKSMAARMPSGVEKMSAQKEIASAQVEMDKGDESQCVSHIHNAAEAMQAHNPG